MYPSNSANENDGTEHPALPAYLPLFILECVARFLFGAVGTKSRWRRLCFSFSRLNGGRSDCQDRLSATV